MSANNSRTQGSGSIAGGKPKTAPTSVAVSSTSNRSAILNSTSLNIRKIFVGGLHYGTVDSGLKRYFSTFGTVESAQVMYNRDTAKSRGFGFVIFTDEEAVDRVLELGTYHVIDEKEVEIKRSVPKSNSTPPAAPVATKSVVATSTSSTGVSTGATASTSVQVSPTTTAESPKPAATTPTSPQVAWKGAKPSTAVTSPVTSAAVRKNSSWVSAVVGNNPHTQPGQSSQPAPSPVKAAAEIPPVLQISEEATKATAVDSLPAPPSPQPSSNRSAPSTPGGAGATISALGLGLDVLSSQMSPSSTAGSSIADMWRSALPTELQGNDTRALPAELPGLFTLPPPRPPHSASWDLMEGGTSISESGVAYSGAESVVSTLTAEDADVDTVDGRRARAKSGGSLILGLSSSQPAPTAYPPQASGLGRQSGAPFSSLPPGLQSYPSQHTVSGPVPMYNPYNDAVIASMAAAALSQMYGTSWMPPAPSAAPYGMPAPLQGFPQGVAPHPHAHHPGGPPPGLGPRDHGYPGLPGYRA